jgi:hypothetical protein
MLMCKVEPILTFQVFFFNIGSINSKVLVCRNFLGSYRKKLFLNFTVIRTEISVLQSEKYKTAAACVTFYVHVILHFMLPCRCTTLCYKTLSGIRYLVCDVQCNYKRLKIVFKYITLTYLLIYGAGTFLKSCQLCSHSGNSQQF